jgi:hypothetical protein
LHEVGELLPTVGEDLARAGLRALTAAQVFVGHRQPAVVVLQEQAAEGLAVVGDDGGLELVDDLVDGRHIGFVALLLTLSAACTGLARKAASRTEERNTRMGTPELESSQLRQRRAGGPLDCGDPCTACGER